VSIELERPFIDGILDVLLSLMVTVATVLRVVERWVVII
jgi:hypothetical protein